MILKPAKVLIGYGGRRGPRAVTSREPRGTSKITRASSPIAERTAPTSSDLGRYLYTSRWVPASTRAPRIARSARSTGDATPSMVSSQPG